MIGHTNIQTNIDYYFIDIKAWDPRLAIVRSTVYPKENRIYIRGEFTRKKCKTAILLYCFHTAGVLHIFVLYI